MRTSVIAARDLCVRLGGRRVLDGATIEARAGEVVAVAGPNGAGKSTLLRALAGLIAPESGGVTVSGTALASLDRRALGREIAYLPQERIVHWPMTVETIVGLGRLPHRATTAAESDEDRRAVASAMTDMDVAQFAQRPVTQLSGGERARVLVARALSQRAQFLVADEPTAGLDPAHALSLFSHLGRLASEGRGVIVALHDLSFAARFAHRLVILKEGRVAVAGAPRDVLTPEHLASIYGVKATIGEIDGLPVVLAHSALT